MESEALIKEFVFFWFRRDLRIEDNHAFYQALKSGLPVVPIFILDTDILEKLDDKQDRRVTFIYKQLKFIHAEFQKINASLQIHYGKPIEVWAQLIEKYKIKAVYVNHDYEPYAINRDKEILNLLASYSISFFSFKDQVIFEKSEVVKPNGLPYTIFTPYSKVWKARLTEENLVSFPSEKFITKLYKQNLDFPSLEKFGFTENKEFIYEKPNLSLNIIHDYHNTRNIPSIENGTTRLSVHLRFGTVSIRNLVAIAHKTNEVWLNELIWREFFMQILFHYPHVVYHSFKPQYDRIQWRNNELEFKKWCEGMTGYPIVDAGMRELNQTGFMHNRVRMIVASFLTKHLLVDWRWGEAYFARKLLDYDLSANNGNWQWAASSGCDAAPYFRIFNPSEQTRKFDPENQYIQKWLSPNDLLNPPIVEHSFARDRALMTYKEGLKE